VTGRDDDETWRSIVENYGERPTLPEPERRPEPPTEHQSEHQPDARREAGDEAAELEEDGYVPPEPPPVPLPERPRLAAWVGLLGAPLLLVVLMLAGATIGSWLLLLLVSAFVGGFGYLVATMSREPRDPWDDGSRI
jgi:hypothetical protein